MSSVLFDIFHFFAVPLSSICTVGNYTNASIFSDAVRRVKSDIEYSS